MLDLENKPAVEFPDDPLKWDGWASYRAESPYERLCLDAATKPTDEQIQQHCVSLLQWWQKKLPLKNQPSNPIAQLLWRGIDEAARFLVEGRMQLLDSARRQQIDRELAEQAQQEKIADFAKYVAFSIARKVLSEEAEANLSAYGQKSGLTEQQTRTCIEEELTKNKARRVSASLAPPSVTALSTEATVEAEKEFHRIPRLSDLGLADATGLVRRIFATIAENLGIHLELAEQLLDRYLDRAESLAATRPRNSAATVAPPKPRNDPPSKAEAPVEAAAAKSVAPVPQPRPRVETPSPDAVPEFTSSFGAAMVRIPAGEFTMGSEANDASPNERPLTPVTLSEFYMSRFPVTNLQFEQFDPSHKQNRLKSAAGDHPVVYVTSFEAIKFCEWLTQKEGKTYRLPTEAEWEYAARGIDGRTFPWGNEDRRGDCANFADASTAFAWRDPLIHDGFAETSPVGSFPKGASFFGIEDMAGNVWEWCLDFYHALPGQPKRNPRSLAGGATRVHRGGSWKSRFSNLRTTARSANAPKFASNDVGFRIVAEIPED